MKKQLFSLMILCGSMMNAQVYSNGNLSTGATSSNGAAAPAGYTWSELQGTNSTLGSSGFTDGTNDFRLADDFVVPAAESWAISSVEMFCYQTGATLMPVDILTVRIFSASPDIGTLLFGNATTNVFDAGGTVDAFMYRTGRTTSGITRKIWKVKGNITATLTPGTYWLDYQVHAINNGAVYFPVVTNVGVEQEPGANAMQGNAGVYNPLVDTGSGNLQALPFIINYVATALGTSEARQYDSRVVVYPNPTVDSFKLSLPSESLGAKTEVEIYDQSGKKVKTFKISDSYDVTDLGKGLYLIKIKDGKNIKTTKLIKN